MMVDVPLELKDMFSNYKMNLLQVSKSGQYKFSNEDVETVFKISRDIYAKNFDGIAQDYKERDIAAELAVVIGKITDSNYIMQKATDGREVLNMCTALEELRDEGIREGKREGKLEGKREGIRVGEEKLALLISFLLEDSRMEELKKMSQDTQFREELYKQYNL